jgi:general secretion pathway protein L
MKLSQAAPGPLLVLAEIADWWTAQMRSLLPQALRRENRLEDALTIAIDPPAAGVPFDQAPVGTIWLRQGGRDARFGTLRPDAPLPPTPRLATFLRLPPGTVLTRDVVLPLAVGRQLHSVMRFEMDRLTPFTAEELYWGISGVTPDRAHGKLRLRLAFVLRAPVDRLRRQLAELQLFPSHIEAPGAPIALETSAKPRRLMAAALPALCGLLALACVATPFLRQKFALAAASQSIAAHMPAAQAALALRRQLTTAAFGRAAIAQAQQSGDALQVLAQLTDALPDGTWLDDLTLKSGLLTVDGQSSDAAALIGRLAASPGLRDPSFTAPVTRTADGKADQFSLQASLTP